METFRNYQTCIRAITLLVLNFHVASLHAQDTTRHVADTINVHELEPVFVTGYGQTRDLQETPAAIVSVRSRQKERFNNAGIVAAINTLPGVHLDERSPASYRLNIRGSSLRSSFGVRNVRIYYNDIPLTDPGGFSYLNQLGVLNMQQLDIIKGPGSSLYGAGNGGVVLVTSTPEPFEPGVTVGYTTGSYALQHATAEIRLGDAAGLKNIIRYQHTEGEGYRQQSRSARDAISWDAVIKSTSNSELAAYFLYNHLNYQTPGGLTLSEYNANPRNARPDAGVAPGAVSNRATIYQENALAGFTLRHRFSNHWQNKTVLYANWSGIDNPTIRNYSKSTEPHFGGRTTFDYNVQLGDVRINILSGGELQQQYISSSVYRNDKGRRDTLQSSDAIEATQGTAFIQATARFKKWAVEAGLSINKMQLSLERLVPASAFRYKSDLPVQLSPRVALLYHASERLSFYGNVARGFSPPTVAELSPSGSAINLSLAPEQGWNYEAGLRGVLFNKYLHYDISLFYFDLTDAIVLRRDSLGGDYYINAGATTQMGAEASLDYSLLRTTGSVRLFRVWLSYSGYYFRYKDFTQAENDFSGNKMPGVTPANINAGLDLHLRQGLRFYVTYTYNDVMPLDDANKNYSDAFHLLGCKVAYAKNWRRAGAELFAGIDNILDQRYSLGNDINAAGGRFYNAAPGVNYYAGLSFTWAGRNK